MSTLQTSTLASKYDELAQLKIEHVQLQLDILNEQRNYQKKESDLRQRSLELDIQIKQIQLEKLMKQ